MKSTPVAGQKVRYLPQPGWGVGHVLEILEHGRRVRVSFPAREEPVIVSTRGRGLVHHELEEGELVMRTDGKPVVIEARIEAEGPLRHYRWVDESGTRGESVEDTLLPLPPRPDLLRDLARGAVRDAHAFLLRRAALRLDDERRYGAAGALFASRVMVMPHQVSVVQRVLDAPRPRFVLADEVGLGKTIEAGMIFTALRLSGLARRVLVVVPSHLTVQWLVELFHKFNQLFTLMDSARYAQEREAEPEASPWSRFDLVITSLEMLARSEEHRAEVAAEPWDLVIFDEAHHLKGDKAFAAAKGVASGAWGLLLLTATPLQLDPEEYQALLGLIDPEGAPHADLLRRRIENQEAISSVVRGLLEGGELAEARARLAQMFPADPVLPEIDEAEVLLHHVAETYSLSERLIRNRRAVVGAFTARRLHRIAVTPSPAEQALRDTVLERLAAGKVRGAALGRTVRRLESSPAALRESLEGALRDLAGAVPERDAKVDAFLDLLARIRKKEPLAKVLVFTESRATLDWLEQVMQREGRRVVAYHGELSLKERDRRVARFRDPEGPPVLISTEVGGEGRNFQFAHHLVNYDLPWSPAAMEQRIGRLDRIGQTRPVDIHVFDVEGTLSADVLSLLDDAVGVFEETVGGLDAVLEEVEPRLIELCLEPPAARAAYAAELAERVSKARARTLRAYDPLLDMRSYSRTAVERLARRTLNRLDVDVVLEEDDAEDALWAVARDLDERLEEVVTALAEEVGLGVDTDEAVEAFECAFHFGRGLRVESLPGLDIQDERTVLGTFWRDTAVEREEIEYFATGHPIVEALFAYVRDGRFGRIGARRLPAPRGMRRTAGVELVFHLEPQEAEDTAPGAQVPSRQLSRYLGGHFISVCLAADENGVPRPLTGLGRLLREEGKPLEAPLEGAEAFLETAFELGHELAESELLERADAAREAILEEAEDALDRLALSLAHQGFEAALVEHKLTAQRRHYEAILQAVEGLRVTLDSACLIVFE